MYAALKKFHVKHKTPKRKLFHVKHTKKYRKMAQNRCIFALFML